MNHQEIVRGWWKNHPETKGFAACDHEDHKNGMFPLEGMDTFQNGQITLCEAHFEDRFPEPCQDCEGTNTRSIKVGGIAKKKDHACGCRDWSYKGKAKTFYRLKWCEYHRKEREEQIKTTVIV